MSRKDTIIVAVLVNAGLLVMLFVSALKSPAPIVPAKETAISRQVETKSTSSLTTSGQDQWDRVLSELSKEKVEIPQVVEQAPVKVAPVAEVKAEVKAEAVPKKAVQELPKAQKAVVVKQGDVLEKIAKTHGVSVQEIMKINELADARLQIGQVLKLPQKEIRKEAPKAPMIPQAVYYTVKNGDNLWKIAIENHLKVEELLKLNNLDDKKAKSLKPGDQLRIK